MKDLYRQVRVSGRLVVKPHLPGDLIIMLLVTALGGLAAWGISESVRAAVLFTFLEVVGLILIVAVAAPNLLELPARLPELIPSMDLKAGHSVFAGAFLAFYAFIGFEDMVNVAEEVRDPQRTMPRAILISLSLASADAHVITPSIFKPSQPIIKIFFVFGGVDKFFCICHDKRE